jgi:MFS family permease
MTPQLWVIILCGATAMTLSLGIRASFGLFLGPISVDLAMSREAFAIALAAQNLLWGAVAPFAGAIADRHGPIRVCVVGGIVYAAGLVLAASGHSVEVVQLGLTAVGIALGIAGFSVVLGAVGRAAPPEHRSVALGIASAGGSFGQFAIVPISQAFVSSYGWSTALLLLAAISFMIVPLAYGLGERKIVPGMQQTLGDAIREASGHRGFWLLTAGFFVCGFQVTFVAVHLPAFIADKGLPAWLGAASLSLIGLFNIAGTLLAGWLGGRYRKKYVLSLLYLFRSLAWSRRSSGRPTCRCSMAWCSSPTRSAASSAPGSAAGYSMRPAPTIRSGGPRSRSASPQHCFMPRSPTGRWPARRRPRRRDPGDRRGACRRARRPLRAGARPLGPLRARDRLGDLPRLLPLRAQGIFQVGLRKVWNSSL